MEAVQSWISEHKLTSIGALWASGIGASLVAYSRIKSPMKPSLRLIHARMHAQALTLAVLSGAAAYHYYENRAVQVPPKPEAHSPAPSITQLVEWELHSPF
ncbi:Hypoxia induced protein, domain [Sesbania bispinosa]|nr:Hypoxia induced protein, domain [Sesbania bispinosa]